MYSRELWCKGSQNTPKCKIIQYLFYEKGYKAKL